MPRHDDDNILGSPAPPTTRAAAAAASTMTGSSSSWTVYVLLALGALALFAWGRGEIKRRRLQGYRKSMRRRHGIGDKDLRPFNIATDPRTGAGLQRLPNPTESEPATPQYMTPKDIQMRQRRVPNGPMPSDNVPDYSLNSPKQPPSTSNRFAFPPVPPFSSTSTPSHSNNHQHSRHGSQNNAVASSTPSRLRGFKRTASTTEADLDPDRNVLDKRARRISALSQSSLPVNMDVDSSLDHDDDETTPLAEGPDTLMEMDSLPFARRHDRGKKRDRAEAGSTFGGDSGDEDTRSEITLKTSRKDRKRRDLRKSGLRHSDLAALDESEGSIAGSMRRHSHGNSRKGRSKRDKDSTRATSTAGSGTDVDMDLQRSNFGPGISTDPLCNGRTIGEEWEVHGQKFRVGPNGQRLRLELVRRTKTRYLMPRDSEHPDRGQDVEYFVECWIGEDEYRLAKEKQELVWQGANGGAGAGQVVQQKGKRLVWDPSTKRTVEVRNEPSPLHSPSPDATLADINAKSKGVIVPASPAGRRMGSSRDILPGSPARLGHRSSDVGLGGGNPMRAYSKWEKQEFEADAMMRVRAKRVEEERLRKEKEDKEKEDKDKASTPALNLSSSTLTPVIGMPTSAAGEKKVEEKKTDAPTVPASASAPSPFTLGLGKPPASASSSTTTAPASAPLFGLPAKPAEEKKDDKAPAAPASFFNKAPEAPKTTSTAAPTLGTPTSGTPITFAKPTATPALEPPKSATAQEPTSSAPAAPAPKPMFAFGSGPPPKSTPSPSPFGAPATATSETKKDEQSAGGSLLARMGGAANTERAKSPAAAPAATTASEKPSFSFGTGAPAATTKSAEPAKSIFGSGGPSPFGTSAPSPSPFGSTKPAEAPKSAPSPFGAPSSGSPFGNTSKPADAPKSAFGSGSGSAFGGFGTTKPAGAEAPKSAFGTPAATPPPQAPAPAAEVPKPSFNFNIGAKPTTPAAEAPKAPVTAFGGSTTAFGGSTSAFGSSGTSAFGAATKPAETKPAEAKPAETKSTFSFNFGSNAPAGAPTASPFGTAAPKTTANGDAGAKKTEFSFGGGSAFGGGSTSGGASPFGAPASATTPASNPFGSTTPAANPFGAPASATAPAASPFGSSAFGASTTPASNPFGAPAAKSPFGTPSATFSFGGGEKK